MSTEVINVVFENIFGKNSELFNKSGNPSQASKGNSAKMSKETEKLSSAKSSGGGDMDNMGRTFQNSTARVKMKNYERTDSNKSSQKSQKSQNYQYYD